MKRWAYASSTWGAAGRAGRLAVLLIVVSLVGAGPALAGKPAVAFRNGSFDTDLSGWRLSPTTPTCNFGDQTVVWTDEVAIAGGAVFLNACGGDAHPWISQAVRLTKGETYRISGWVRLVGEMDSFAVLVDGSAATVVYGTGLPWRDFTVDFTATRARSTISFVGEVGADVESWVDSLSIAAT